MRASTDDDNTLSNNANVAHIKSDNALCVECMVQNMMAASMSYRGDQVALSSTGVEARGDNWGAGQDDSCCQGDGE